MLLVFAVIYTIFAVAFDWEMNEEMLMVDIINKRRINEKLECINTV